jgi:hypothetical protein
MGRSVHLLPFVALLVACDDPRAKKTEVAPEAAEPPAAIATAPPSALPSAVPSAEPAKDDDDAAGAVPPLVDDTGKPLPQTEEKPSLRSKSWERRVKLLFRAIQIDDPEVAIPSFFPKLAYEQVKAIPKPAVDFEARLLAAFRRDIHAAHKALGQGAGSAQLVGLEVPEEKAKWMPPGSEGNKLGYHRVLGSKLRYLDGGGAPRAVNVTSLISWRGEWYVVHLAGFK